MKSILDWLNSNLDTAQKQINGIKDIAVETIQNDIQGGPKKPRNFMSLMCEGLCTRNLFPQVKWSTKVFNRKF